MGKFKNLMNLIKDDRDSRICVIKEVSNDNIAYIEEMLFAGKYWIKKGETGEIFPPMPDELMDAQSGLGAGTFADYLILAPNFDDDAYWSTVSKNPVWFPKKANRVNTDISCEEILRLDAEKVSVVEDFKAMAAANNLTPGELIGYLFEKL